MKEFEPRLLIPGTPGIPSHIALADDPRVYGALRDPAITAAVYVPRWSAPVREAFARRAELKAGGDFEDRISISPAMLANIGDIEDFALDTTVRWLRPAFKPHAREENIHVVHEVAAAQAQFAQAAARLLEHHPGRRPYYHALLRNLHVHAEADTRVHACHPEVSRAHTDPGDTGLFAQPLGTVLVDHEGLDIKGLRQAENLSARSLYPVHRIGLVHLANRLWQVPDGAFGLWRGEPHVNAQYHFFPEITGDIQRFRAFSHP